MLLGCLLLSINFALAQAQNPLWNIVPNYTKNFGTPNPLPGGWATATFPNSGYVNPVGSNNMYKDGGGNPLFFTNGSLVFNNNGYLIDELYLSYAPTYAGTPNDATGYSETCIVPKPGSCTQYYIFTCGLNDTSNSTVHTFAHGYRPYYALIDVAQPNPNTAGQYGKNITSGTPSDGTVCDLFKSTSTPGTGNGEPAFCGDVFYAATKARGDGSRFLFVTNNDVIFVYKITSSGVSYKRQYVISSLTTSGGSLSTFGNTVLNNITEMEVYQDDANHLFKLAFGTFDYGVPGGIVLANFDTTATFIANSAQGVDIAGGNPNIVYSPSGIEFSPNGNYVYFTHHPTTAFPTAVTAIQYSSPATTYTFTTDTTFLFSQIEMGTDSNLYLIKGLKDSTGTLYKLSHPNTPATATIASALSLTDYSMVHFYTIVPSLASFTLPDQIDGEVYTDKTTGSTACCLFNTPYDKQTYYAGQITPSGWTAATQTWSATSNPINNGTGDTVTIGQELRIPAGYTVTINNMKIKFSPQARLIIENSFSGTGAGKLILSGCTLTVDNRCVTDMWPGIQVWGTPGQNQIPSYQGFLQMPSGNIIENAYVAVLAGYDTTWFSNITPRPLSPINTPASCGFTATSSWNNGANASAGGAIIQGIGTTFFNNQRGAIYVPYTHTASGGQYLQTCTFNVNAALLNSSVSPRYFLGLFGHTNTFAVNGCSFTDSYNLYKDTGLYTSNSTAWVDEYSTTRSIFTTLKYGIYGINTPGNTNFIYCKNSTFNNNYYGIYLGNINNAIVEMDTFRIFVSSCSGRCGFINNYGLYLDVGTSYSVRDNYFTKYGTGTPTNNYLYGIVANNSPNANIIFRNTFNNITVGNQAQFQNYVYATHGTHNVSGLQYVCNIFSSGTINNADIFVPGNLNGDTITYSGASHAHYAGVSFIQGDGNSGSLIPNGGNQFSHTSTGVDFYIDTAINHTYNSGYFYYCVAPPTCPQTSSSLYPLRYRDLSPAPTTYSIDCTVNTYTCVGCRTSATADPNQAMLGDADGYLQTYNSLQAQIDGGSTSGLLSLIAGNNNSQAVYNSLNAAVPYLSDDVLIAYINSEYPVSDIKQILTSCSPLTDEVNKALGTSNLSADTKSQLSSLQTGSTSKMFQLYLDMGSAFSSRHLILDKIIRSYLQDSIPANVQKGYALMKVKALELPARNQVETGVDLNDTAMVTTALTQVANEEGQSNFVKLCSILLQNLGKSPQQLLKDPSVLSTVQALATDSSDRSTYLRANALLQTVGLSKFVPYIIPNNKSTQDETGRNAVQPTTTSVVTSASTLINSPNPFKESTTVKAIIVEKTQNAFIVITDMVGNEIARYPVQQGENNINVSAGGLNQAVMFCTLVVDGVKIKTNKMVLIK